MIRQIQIIKRIAIIALTILLSIDSFAVIVSDNDGSAFITKAEFDSLKNEFKSQIESYNVSIDSKIDGAIAAYLAGIRVSKNITLNPEVEKYDDVVWTDTFLINYYKKDWYDSSTGGKKASPTLSTAVWGCPPKERFHVMNADQRWFNVFGVTSLSNDEYYSQSWDCQISFNNYSTDYTATPFTSNYTVNGLTSLGAPHFAVLSLGDDGRWLIKNIYREYALTNTIWLGLKNGTYTSGASYIRQTATDFNLSQVGDDLKLDLYVNYNSTNYTYSFNYAYNRQQMEILHTVSWNTNTSDSTARAKTSGRSSGANNPNVNDYTWTAYPSNSGNSINDYLLNSLFGNIGENDTINVIYQADNGAYDWSKANTSTELTSNISKFHAYKIDVNRDPTTLATSGKSQFVFKIPNFSELSLRDINTNIKSSRGYLKHGQGLPLCFNIPSDGTFTIKFKLIAYNAELAGTKFSISKDNFDNPYKEVKGSYNKGNEITLNNINASEDNEIKIEGAKEGDNYWIKIIPGNNAGTTSSNSKVVKMSNLTMELETN